MATLFVSGPCELHVGVGSGGGLAFLGWSEAGVIVETTPYHEPVIADIGGPRVATDTQLMGESAVVRAKLKVVNHDVWELVASRAGPRTGGAVLPGVHPGGAMGALMAAEGMKYRLLVYRPYSQKAVFLARRDPMRPAYNYALAYLLPDTTENSTRALGWTTAWQCDPLFDPATGGWKLYDADFAGKPPTL